MACEIVQRCVLKRWAPSVGSLGMWSLKCVFPVLPSQALVAPALSRSPVEIPSAVRDKAADPPGLRDQSLKLFEDWVHLLNMHAEDKVRVDVVEVFLDKNEDNVVL